jgi:hypothetical protein
MPMRVQRATTDDCESLRVLAGMCIGEVVFVVMINGLSGIDCGFVRNAVVRTTHAPTLF